MYDPSVGRWMQEDPIQFQAGDPNLYRYARNDPTNATDPTGLATASDVGPYLAYYADAGWVDWNHADPTNARKVIEDVRGRRDTGIDYYTQRADHKVIGKEAPGLLSGVEAILCPDTPPRKQGHFIISVRNLANTWTKKAAYPITYYAIRSDIREDEVLPVALAIYLDHQDQFEAWQASPLLRRIGHSGYSQEDIVSDYIGFYMAVKNWTKADVEPLLGTRISDPEARELMGKLGNDLSLPENQNRTVLPVDHNALVPSLAAHGPIKWPTQLTGITPAPPGYLWDRANVYTSLD